MTAVEIEPGYLIKISDRKNKKYDILDETGKYILSFGDDRYQQFHDSTPIGFYIPNDHNDEKRKNLYYARHGTTTDKNTAKYWAQYLW